jgi:hypothetical protein
MTVVARLRVREIIGEVPTGLVDDFNTSFYTAHGFIAGTTRLYLNGVRQLRGAGNDYVEVGSSQVMFNFIPRYGQVVIDYYRN